MKTKKISPSFVGLGALAVALCLNFVYASNDYGISDNSLSIEVLAQMNRSDSGSGSGTGTGKKKYEVYTKRVQDRTTVTCNGATHSITVETGHLITCKGEGNIDCTEGWYPTGGRGTATEKCPGDKCKVRNY